MWRGAAGPEARPEIAPPERKEESSVDTDCSTAEAVAALGDLLYAEVALERAWSRCAAWMERDDGRLTEIGHSVTTAGTSTCEAAIALCRLVNPASAAVADAGNIDRNGDLLGDAA
jgi:hypothetical protein